MNFSERSDFIKPSATLALTAKAGELKAAGKPVLSFTAGEPDFDTPESIKQSAIEALGNGYTKYLPVAGLPKLRESIAEKTSERGGADVKASQVIVASGAKQTIFNACLALLNAGDEAIIFSPYWVSYPEMIRFCGAVPVSVDLDRSNNLEFNEEKFRASISEKTKLVIVNSPNNPSGSCMTKDDLETIYNICREKNLWILSDEIYADIYYSGDRAPGLEDKLSDYNKLIIVNGFSKIYSMTGWRLGYIVADPALIKVLSKIQGQSTSCATSFAQYAAVTALELPASTIQGFKETFRGRKELLKSLVSKSSYLELIEPQGAFYGFLNLEKACHKLGMSSSMEFCEHLISEHFVVTVPGEPFGCPGFARLSYACSEEQIRKGIARIREAIGE